MAAEVMIFYLEILALIHIILLKVAMGRIPSPMMVEKLLLEELSFLGRRLE